MEIVFYLVELFYILFAVKQNLNAWTKHLKRSD